MLTLALDSLSTVSKVKRKGIFAHKYQATHHLATDTLTISDLVLDRGTIYQVQRGKEPTINQLTEAEKAMFTLPLEMNSPQKEVTQWER